MSVWLPRRPPPSLLARHVLTGNVLRSRAVGHLIVYRALGTAPPAQDSRSASTSARTTPVPATPAHSAQPTAEPKSPSPPATSKEVATPQGPLATRVWKKVKHEAQHYWHGSKLLVSEVRISGRLQWKLLHGDTLTRRERRQVSIVGTRARSVCS